MTMDRKEHREPPKDGIKLKDNRRSFNRVVSEDSTVIIDVRDIVKDIDNINSIKHSSLKQTSGTPVVIEDDKDKKHFSFTAPYVKNNDLRKTAYDELSFQLTVKDDGNTKNASYNVDIIVKRVQRAVIFQGGVALGAYEAGVFRAIVEKLVKNDKDKKRKGIDTEKRPLFDIVAGTSIGAMNAAIVVSSVMDKSTGKSLEDRTNWKDSAEKVIQFWSAQQQFPTYADLLDWNPFYHYTWDIIHNTSKMFKSAANDLIEQFSNMNPALKSYGDIIASYLLISPSFWKDVFIDGWYIPATAEARRRYYSAKQFIHTFGPINVASGIFLGWPAFAKFFDFSEQSNWIPRPDNKHFVLYSLKRTLERFADFPIKTSPKERKEPRLLLVTVDVKTGDAVTFDSYTGETKYHDDKNTIPNEDGIEIDHALASGTFPDFFDYPKFKVTMNTNNSEEHIFWDGGFRSNTPLREVLQAHREYWHKIVNNPDDERDESEKENDVPDLEVYIADLWPSQLSEDPISFDRDFVENNKWNLILDGKTDYDEQVASVITDYIDLTKQLKNLAEQKGASPEEINHILSSCATSMNTKGRRRKYGELLGGRFRLTKVVHIDRMDDENEVNDKVFDYSHKTIEELIDVGYYDASVQMDIQQMKDGVMELSMRNMNGDVKGEWNKNHQELEKSVYRIQEVIKVQNGYNNDTIKQLNDFKGKVEQIGELLPKDVKVSLIAAAERLKETIESRDRFSLI